MNTLYETIIAIVRALLLAWDIIMHIGKNRNQPGSDEKKCKKIETDSAQNTSNHKRNIQNDLNLFPIIVPNNIVFVLVISSAIAPNEGVENLGETETDEKGAIALRKS